MIKFKEKTREELIAGFKRAIERKKEFEEQAQKEFADMRKRGAELKSALWNRLIRLECGWLLLFSHQTWSSIYKIGFMDDDTIWESGAYQFVIVNENHTPSPNDPKLRETIFCIIENFFKVNPEILLYLCETGDGKQASRNRLFVRWFREYAQKHLYYFDTVEMSADGIENFAAIIVQKTNPMLNEIVETFNYVVNTLKDKPE